MRKILLATTALVAFAGAAQAAESPIQVTLGGSVDFRAAMFQEAEKTTDKRRDGDFQTEYRFDVAADGKAAGGIEYGAKVTFYNGESLGVTTTTADTDVRLDQAYVYMSGAWGKVLMGDEHGASDLFIVAPFVGEGQIAGSYQDFTDPATLAPFQPAYADGMENNTKVTYYTPKVGNANHKVQLGVSYTPKNRDRGIAVAKYDANAYHNLIESTIQYTGTIEKVNLALASVIATGDGQGDKSAAGADVRDFTSWGVGGQTAYAGFTFGASYVDAGHMATSVGENKDQNVYTVGLKYEFDKVAMAVNYLNGKGYMFGEAVPVASVYVDRYSAFGFGATYTWFPGLTTAVDAVFFDQSIDDVTYDNEGHVLMLSQKMTF